MTDARSDSLQPTLPPLTGWQRAIVVLLWVVSIASLILFSFLYVRHFVNKKTIIESSKKNLQRLTNEAVADIEAILQSAMVAVDSVADELSSGVLTGEDSIKERLSKMVRSNDHFYGAAIAYRPFGFDAGRRLYAPYYRKPAGSNQLEYAVIDYDYTNEKYDWYVDPMKEGNRWGEPYWGPVGKTLMTTYSAVFYEPSAEQTAETRLGVVTVDISMEELRNIIVSLELGSSGFGALISRKGTYLYHPNNDYVRDQKSILNVAQEKDDHTRRHVAKLASRGEGGIVDHVSTTTGQKSWFIFQPVQPAGWSLQNTFIKDDIPIDATLLRRQLIWCALATLICLHSFTMLALKVYRGSPQRIWIATAISALALMACVGFIWQASITYDEAKKVDGVKVAAKAALDTVESKYTQRCEDRDLEPPIYVPTGIYVETLKFSGASDVVVSGYIWGKYANGMAGATQVEPGVIIGEARNVTISEPMVEPMGDFQVVRWRFSAELSEMLRHTKYPLEQEMLDIHLMHTDFNRRIVLVPDLDAYKLISPSLLPGIDKATFLPGWKLTSSFFELRERDVGTNFGVSQHVDREKFPELHFNIQIKRTFIDAFISNLTPLIIVSLMLFGLLILTGKLEFGRAISICVAIFFVIVFSHIDIRRRISAQEIFYLEYFYFLVYCAILWVCVNAIREPLNLELKLFTYRDGLLLKALYWPIFLGVILIVTMVTFY